MSASAQRRKNREAAARRRAAATAAAQPERKMASFRENAGENRAHQVQNGASAVALAKSGGAPPIADLRGGGGIDPKTGSTLPAPKPASVSSSDDKAKPKPEAPKAKPVAQGEPGVLRYPMEALSDTTDYLQIDIVEYKSAKELSGGNNSFTTGPGSRNIGQSTGRKGLTSKGLATKRLKDRGTIILQMPSSIQDGNSASYGESKMNTIMGAAAGAVKETMTGVGEAIGNAPNIEKAVKNGLEAGKDAFSGLRDSEGILGGAKTLLTNQLTASALGALGGNVSAADLLARSTGQMFNPNMELLFNGPTLRSFRFSFKFTPRNAKEAEQVKLIIRTFKSNMAPKVDASTQISGNALFIKTPNVFELRYRRGIQNHPFLHKFKQCFLTDVSVNYTGEGVYATYDDSTPISMQMDLTFKELEPIYNTDYEDSDVGVGF